MSIVFIRKRTVVIVVIGISTNFSDRTQGVVGGGLRMLQSGGFLC